MAGASPEEHQHLHLANKTHYRYLGHRASANTRINGLRDDDANHFEQLKMALKSIGLSKRHVAQTCQLVAAILHPGNIDSPSTAVVMWTRPSSETSSKESFVPFFSTLPPTTVTTLPRHSTPFFSPG
ncbi:hypothetical protein JVT61DRAFT_8020 [Boletus reticuloceps]|uniref:Myosin motor domain-containing protein n=1 Tax=Boletus reticuloceps TaxID=495285 RepID=A0A8I2YHN6_9AGAM|nr:hypothetical protein JVT61DRAFT_8020 [Boletus reticuloceps]